MRGGNGLVRWRCDRDGRGNICPIMKDTPALAPTLSRRQRVICAALNAGAALHPGSMLAAGRGALDVIAFDAFPMIADRSRPRPDTMFRKKGAEPANAWGAKLFGYGWLLTAAGHSR